MKICKKCGSSAGYNSYFKAYYCDKCGNLNYDDVYSKSDIFKEWQEYKNLGYTPEELKERLELAWMYENLNK